MTDYMKEAERLAVHLTHAAGTGDRDAETRFLAALLAHIQRGAVPEGWQLVPINHTPEMRAAWDGAPDSEDDDMAFHFGYRAMLAAAPDHLSKDIQRGAAEGWRDAMQKLGNLPSFLAGWKLSESCIRNDMETEVSRWIDGLSELYKLYAAPAPDHFRDAAEMVAEPAEVPMPEPDCRYLQADGSPLYSYMPHTLRTYGDAREAAGYARGLKEAGRDAERYRYAKNNPATMYERWEAIPLSPEEIDAAIDAALRGEVKP